MRGQTIRWSRFFKFAAGLRQLQQFIQSGDLADLRLHPDLDHEVGQISKLSVEARRVGAQRAVRRYLNRHLTARL